jgi:hypothetical protein
LVFILVSSLCIVLILTFHLSPVLGKLGPVAPVWGTLWVTLMYGKDLESHRFVKNQLPSSWPCRLELFACTCWQYEMTDLPPVFQNFCSLVERQHNTPMSIWSEDEFPKKSLDQLGHVLDIVGKPWMINTKY